MDKLLIVLSLLLPGALGALPTTFVAKSYDLALTVPSTLTTAVDGTVTISLTCQTDGTTAIVLHWGASLTPTTPSTSNLTITYTPPGASSTPVSITTFTTAVNTATNQLTITPTGTTPQTFANGGVVSIVATFQTRINAESKGLFYRQYLIENNQNNTVLLTNLRPTFARELFPCLDEPRYSAALTLTLTYPSTWTSVAASAAVASSAAGPTSGTTRAVFNAITLPPNTFGLFLAENMVQADRSVPRSPTRLTFWSRRGLATNSFSAMCDFIQPFYYLVEEIIGTNSPLATINVVFIPGLEEPVSNYGVIFIREQNYALDYSTPQMEGLFRANVAPVVYQFIRQFTEFSTRPTAWSDYWISQAVGRYLQYVTLNTVMPMFDMKTDLEVVDRQTALYLDSLPDARPLQDTQISIDSTPAVQLAVNDPLKGLKGAAILNMLDQSLPAGSVFRVIQSFLTNNKATLTTTDDFLTALRTITGSTIISNNARSSLTDTLGFWISTNRYPLEAVSVSVRGQPGAVTFAVSGYCSVFYPSCSSQLPGTYYISTTVGSKSENRYFTPRQDFWVRSTDTSTSTSINVLENDWVVANMKSGGYYRTSYDVDNWARILTAVASRDPTLLERSQVLDDAFNLALSPSNSLNPNTTVRLALANLGNNMYRNWVPVKRGLRNIGNVLQGLDIYSAYRTFAAGYFPNLDQFLKNSSVDAFELARIQALFLEDMCEYDVTGYRTAAIGNLTLLLVGNLPTTVPSSAYDAVACCGARYSTNLRAQTLWNTVVDPSKGYYSRRYAAIAMGCLSSYTDVSLMFNTITRTNVQLNRFIQTLLEKVVDYNAANFLTNLTQMADQFQTQLGPATVASLIVRAGSKINKNTDVAVLDAISNNNNIDAVVKTTVTNTKSVVQYKASWLASNNATLVDALRTFALPSGTTSGANILSVTSLLVFFPSLLYILFK